MRKTRNRVFGPWLISLMSYDIISQKRGMVLIMDMQEVLRQILPCDTQKPYIFISYSNQDKQLVWQDVLEFQRMGYNVWLDEKNLDKTKASWKDDALTAIEDMYCMLVVFYVSKSSLLSDACYRELSKTTDELTAALHYGPVKFIAIDVNEIGDIMAFTRELHQSVFQDATLSKEQKSKMLITLHQFMKDFFGSNNEKVRVHPKNEINRKMNYYEEIVASFPDATANCVRKEKEPDTREDIPERKYIQVEQKLLEESEARKRAEEESRLLSEKLAQMAESAQSTIQLQHGFEDESHMRQKVIAAIARANTEYLSSSSRIMSVDEAGEAKVANAIRTYAKNVKAEDVVGLIDNTLFGSAKEGCIITKDALYSDDFKGRSIEWNKIASYEIAGKKYDVDITYKDGTKQRFFITTVRQKLILPLLDAMIAEG